MCGVPSIKECGYLGRVGPIPFRISSGGCFAIDLRRACTEKAHVLCIWFIFQSSLTKLG